MAAAPLVKRLEHGSSSPEIHFNQENNCILCFKKRTVALLSEGCLNSFILSHNFFFKYEIKFHTKNTKEYFTFIIIPNEFYMQGFQSKRKSEINSGTKKQ